MSGKGIRLTPQVRMSHKAQVIRDITGISKLYAEEALENVITIMRKSDDEGIRLKAAQLILERAYGKPTQHNEHSGPDGGAIPVKAEVAFVSSPARGS